MYYVAAVMIITAIAFAFTVFAQGSYDEKNREFLKSYGWETEGNSIERADIIIPDPFDLVYESYNKMQLEAGLDLREYMGMSGTRYTYVINNYPESTDDEVRANVICINDSPVGGDICTVSLNGFMHSLNYPEKE